MKISQLALLVSGVFPTASASNLLRGSQSEDETRIIGGDEANAGEYPYAVSLSSDSIGHFCGGSMIAPDVVLSAA
jgi:trypsin